MSTPVIQDKENIQSLAQGLEKVSLDVIDTHEPVLVSHWFKSGEDLDVHFIVRDDSILVKQHVCFYGQVVEWNEYEGIKTGFVQEIESKSEPSIQETIRFDMEVSKVSVDQVIEILKNTTNIESKWLAKMLYNFSGEVAPLPTEIKFWPKLVGLLKSLFTKAHK